MQNLQNLVLAERETQNEQDAVKKAEQQRKTEELEQKVRSDTKDLDFSLSTGLEAHKSSLQRDWLSYNSPTMTVEDFIVMYETDVSQGRRDRLSVDCIIEIGLVTKGILSHKVVKSEGARREAEPLVPPGEEPAQPAGGAVAQTPPAPLYTYSHTPPLAFTGEIVYELLAPIVATSSLSGATDWAQTLKRLLRFGERIGLTRPMIGQSIQLLCAQILPHYSKTIENMTDENQIWKQASSFLDLADQKKKVKVALGNIVREPGDDVGIALQMIRNLAIEYLRLENPDNTVKNLESLAEKHAFRCISSLVEKSTWTEIQRYKMQRWKNLNKSTSLSELSLFIMETEQKEEFKLQMPKRLRQRNIDVEVNVFGGSVISPISDVDAELEQDNDEDDDSDWVTVNMADTDVFSRSASPAVMEPASAGKTKFQQKRETRKQFAPGTYKPVSQYRWGQVGATSPKKNSVFPKYNKRENQFAAKPQEAVRKVVDGNDKTDQEERQKNDREEGGNREDSSRSPRDRRDRSRSRSLSRSDRGNSWRERPRSRDRTHSRDRNRSVSRDRRSGRDRRDSRDRHDSRDRRDYKDNRRDGGGAIRRDSYRDSGYRRSYGSRNRSRDRYSRRKSRSPFSGRDRLVARTRSGNYRSISRSRLMTRKSDGTLHNRALSRSPSPRMSRCSRCNRMHRTGSCNLGNDNKHHTPFNIHNFNYPVNQSN